MTSDNTRLGTKHLSGRKILVVEDEYFLADDTVNALKAAGAEIIAMCDDVAEALNVIATADTIDGAVLDVSVRGEMIYPVATVLRERSVPFVFATGFDRGYLMSEFQDVPRWEKPFEAEDLVLALGPMVDAARPSRS